MVRCTVSEVSEGDFIGDYQVLDVLGRGPTGTTYHVVSNVLGKEFVLKTLVLGLHVTPEWLDRLQGQTALLQKVVHPHIDTPVSSGNFGNMWLCVKDFVHDGEGQSCNLRQFLERHGGRLSHYQTCQVAFQVASALSCAHAYRDDRISGVCHGNLKPENILIAYGAEEVRLTDFQPYGLMTGDVILGCYDGWQDVVARYPSLIGERAMAEALSTLYRCYDYIAPEVIAGGKPTVHGDLYAFGVLLYEMLTGEVPCGRFPVPSEIMPEVGEAWDDIMMKCLQECPEGRYRTVQEFADVLKERFGDIIGGDAEVVSPVKERKERYSITPKGMVYVPAGVFLVGSEECGNDALPQHECSTKGFYMDRTPVTNAQFSCFVLETGYVSEAEQQEGAPLWMDGEWKVVPGISWRNPFGRKLPENFNSHPVTQVTYNDAVAYCEWLGHRLPTEEEWEYAARGGCHHVHFPWGDTESYAYAHCNSDATCAVMQHHANGYGLYDIVGNVFEWTSSWYQPYPGNSGTNAHFGEKYRVVRGGCWMYDLSHCLISYRNANQPEYCYSTVGFRTVKDFQP